jgi:hypothetical protein
MMKPINDLRVILNHSSQSDESSRANQYIPMSGAYLFELLRRMKVKDFSQSVSNVEG